MRIRYPPPPAFRYNANTLKHGAVAADMNLTFDQERIPLSVWPDGSVRVDGGRLHLAVTTDTLALYAAITA